MSLSLTLSTFAQAGMQVGMTGALTWSISNNTLTITGTGAMPDYTTTVPWYNYRSSIKSVIINDGITRIGDYAFNHCSSLSSITIPESVTSIGNSAFNRCSRLSNISVDNANAVFASQDGVLFSKTKTTLIRYPSEKLEREYSIPESVMSIGNNAFSYCSNLSSITIPEGVASIGSYAFFYCSNLSSITIPEGVTSIGELAFAFCSNLSSITIPEGVTNIGISTFEDTKWYNEQPNGVVYLGRRLYKYKGTMPTNTTVAVKDGTVSISSAAFDGCSNLISITIPQSVTSIGGVAFYNCTSLSSITLPEGVTSIATGTFLNCSSLSSITIPERVTSIGESAFSGCSSLSSITIPERVTSIAESAFSGCSSLSSITIPESVTSIGGGAFHNTKWYNGLWDGVIYLGRHLYKYKGTMPTNTTVAVKDGTVSISSAAFDGCSNLISITIPQSMTSIGSGAFRNCTSLSSITLPEGVTSISDRVFERCFSLSSITLPEGVTSIGNLAFAYCGSLSSITIPESVTSIGGGAFGSSLKHIYMKRVQPIKIDGSPFRDVGYASCVLHVPKGSKQYYEKAAGWMLFANIVEDIPNDLIETVENAADYVYYNAADGCLYLRDDAREAADAVEMVQVFGVDGRLVLGVAVGQANVDAGIDLSGLPQGMYVVKIQTKAKAFTVKVLKP